MAFSVATDLELPNFNYPIQNKQECVDTYTMGKKDTHRNLICVSYA